MANFWKVVNNVIKEADVLLEVLDARSVDDTRNIEIENKIEKSGKKLIYVINKCDLIEQNEAEAIKKRLPNSIFMSAVERLGTKKLREKILTCCGTMKEVKVGVLGYPNTGKSSIINALKGKGSAKTSAQSGFTKGKQLVRISRKIVLIDTPGVMPYREEDAGKHAMTSARSFHDLKDPDLAALQLIEALKGKVEKHYGVSVSDDPEDTLEAIALKMNCVKKGGKPDIATASKKLIQDWQKGKIV